MSCTVLAFVIAPMYYENFIRAMSHARLCFTFSDKSYCNGPVLNKVLIIQFTIMKKMLFFVVFFGGILNLRTLSA